MAALKIDNISKRFGATQVLHRIDLDLADGDFLVLVGPSGCGKSTLMNIVAGLETPSTGAVHLGGRDITELAPDLRDVSMVFQSYALYPNMTVAENISFPLEMRKVPKAERQAVVNEVSKLLQIDHLLERKPRQLSGGQRQRVAIGRALARKPALFLFDEPLSNLDAKLRVDMRSEIKRLHMNTGVTTIYVTHDQVEAMTLGTRIAVLKDGVIQQLATPMQLYEKPANTFVASFIGSPAINLFDGKIDANGRVFIGDLDTGLLMSGVKSQVVSVGIRPEDFVLGEGSFQAKVSLIEPTGAETYVIAKNELGEFRLRLAGAPALQNEQSISLHFSSNKVHVFEKISGNRL